ncbi:MAG: toll/interleukin-1 receptor domain-containing protein [Cyanobacteria bacterium J06642_12]
MPDRTCGMSEGSSTSLNAETVFISYAREDEVWARERARVLQAAGKTVFLDLDRIEAGAVWSDVLLTKVAEAELVWLFWSRYSAQSDWVKREYTEALKKGDNALRIDRLDDTRLPAELGHIQAEEPLLRPNPSKIRQIFKNPVRELPAGNEQPSKLLRAEYGVVPFFGRTQWLQDFKDWCNKDWSNGERDFAARLLVGAGGLGKTRLAIEACIQLQLGEKIWETGFVDRKFGDYLQAEPGIAGELLRLRRDVLLVVDYAETRREQVKALLDAVLAEQGKRKVRLLLLARSEGDWWKTLIEDNFEYEELLGIATVPERLPPLAMEIDARDEIFRQAVQAFSGRISETVPKVEPPDLSSDEFDRVLFIHLAALAAASGLKIEERDRLLDFAISRERKYWERAADDLDEFPKHLKRALPEGAAAIVLAGGCERDRVAEVVARVPKLAPETPLSREALGQVFIDLYEVENRIEPLQPDLLGEQLLSSVFQANKTFRTAWVQPSLPEELRNGLTNLNRLAARQSEAKEWLKDSLLTNLERAAKTGIEVAIEGGDPIGQILANCVLRFNSIELAVELEALLPRQTIVLRELSFVVTEQILKNKVLDAPDKVGLFNNLGARLLALGRHEEALQAMDKAIEIYRQLTLNHPNEYFSVMAWSLNNLGTILSFLGKREESLRATEEAVEISQKLVQTNPEIHQKILAESLSNLGNRLSYLGRREDALEAAKKAVDIRRRLAQDYPRTFKPDLVTSLNVLGNLFSDLGRLEEALKAGQEAVDLRRQLV